MGPMPRINRRKIVARQKSGKKEEEMEQGEGDRTTKRKLSSALAIIQ